MKQHELNRMFHALAPSPEREQALLEKLLQNDKRRETPVKNWKRIAVCAAVAALLITCAVGAVATVPLFSKMEVKEESKGVYWLTGGGITFYPVESLSEELRALDGQGPDFSHRYEADRLTFESWDRVEEFVGLDLMNNPVLEVDGTQIPYEEFNVQIYGVQFLLETDKDLKQIWINGSYQVGDVSVNVDHHVFTERMTDEDRQHGMLYGYDYTYYQEIGIPIEITEENYTAPNGLETLLVLDEDCDSGRGGCLTTVSLNGIRTTISTSSPNGVKEARDVMIQILDAFTP